MQVLSFADIVIIIIIIIIKGLSGAAEYNVNRIHKNTDMLKTKMLIR